MPQAVSNFRLAPKLLVAAVLATAMLFAASAAHADSAGTLTVVGTSDVSDSGLIPNLIQPEFQNQYPQYQFEYIGKATGTAIGIAEAGGATGPSVLIVHAASLENQFVTGGFSYQNQPGYAIFRNDFVLAGPTGDPAGIGTSNDVSNIAASMAAIASGGAAGNAYFDSRGGTNTAPGTTVEEHKLWALMNTAGLSPSGVILCDVSAADGGGMTPISSSVQSTSGMACPDNGTVSQADAPAWYVINSNTTQTGNVMAANSCTQGAGKCYVLSDRGTVDYLMSGTTAGTVNLIPNLKIVTRDDSASAPGGQYELVNYFHAYIINPSAPNESVNLAAAQAFISFLTSQSFQAQLKNYLENSTITGDSGGAPFVADASPTITESGLPTKITAGTHVTITGSVTNNEIGYPVLSGKPVSIDEVVAGLPQPVRGATTTTTSTGGYSITFTPASSGSYEVVTPQITQLEDPTLSPTYSDTLSAGASTPISVMVTSAPTILVKAVTGGATVSGSLVPAAPDGNGRVIVLARKRGSTGSYSQVGGTSLTTGQTAYSANVSLAPGRWQLEVSYQDDELATGTSATANVTVSASSTAVTIKKSSAKKGKVTVSGSLSQAAGGGAMVELFALQTGKLGATRKTVRELGARIASASFKRVGKASVKAGKTTFTITGRLKRGYSYVLQLEFTQTGQPASFSKVSSLAVH
jgi:ABC-type tungstate transport system permease subunit